MYFALGLMAMFIIGGLSGVIHSSPPADLRPKMFGRLLTEVGLMLSPRVGPWGITAGLAILFFGVFNWVFERGYSEFTMTVPHTR